MANWAFAILSLFLLSAFVWSHSAPVHAGAKLQSHTTRPCTPNSFLWHHSCIYSFVASCARSPSAQGGNMKQRTICQQGVNFMRNLLLDNKHRRQWDVHIPFRIQSLSISFSFMLLFSCFATVLCFMLCQSMLGQSLCFSPPWLGGWAVNCQVRVSKKPWGETDAVTLS